MSEEYKAACSKAQKKRNLFGENNPFYGHKHTEEQKAKWSEQKRKK